MPHHYCRQRTPTRTRTASTSADSINRPLEKIPPKRCGDFKRKCAAPALSNTLIPSPGSSQGRIKVLLLVSVENEGIIMLFLSHAKAVPGFRTGQ